MRLIQVFLSTSGDYMLVIAAQPYVRGLLFSIVR